jgi:hypothetical protein
MEKSINVVLISDITTQHNIYQLENLKKPMFFTSNFSLSLLN